MYKLDIVLFLRRVVCAKAQGVLCSCAVSNQVCRVSNQFLANNILSDALALCQNSRFWRCDILVSFQALLVVLFIALWVCLLHV